MASNESTWAERQAKSIAAEIHRQRGSRSAQWLSDRTAEYGHKVARTTISELENGRRKYVSVAELCVLAQALDISPAELLYPFNDDELIEYLPGQGARSTWALEWFMGYGEARMVKRLELERLRRARDRKALHEKVRLIDPTATTDPELAAYASTETLTERINKLTAELRGDGG